MSLISNFKSLPKSTKGLLSIGLILGLFVALPLFVWAVINLKFDIRERASTVSPIPAYIGAEDSPFKILFININNAPYFDSIVDGFITNKYNTLSPYKENYYLTSFYKISLNFPSLNGICGDSGIPGSSGYYCNSEIIINEIKKTYPTYNSNDFINMAYVETTYAGAAGRVITVGVYPGISEEDTVAHSGRTTIHELSHLFGLMDYAIGFIKYDGTPNQFWDPSYLKKFYNIDSPSCSKWCQSVKPVSEYNQSVSSACLSFETKNTCLQFNRDNPDNYCAGNNCCVWSETPFEYFNSKCVPWKGSENIGLQCLPDTGCYFAGAYSHFVWRPVLPEGESVMLGGDGELDNVSKKHIESVFRCCMDSTYSSSLTQDLNCSSFKNEYEKFLNDNMISNIGLCTASVLETDQPFSTYTPTATASATTTATASATVTATATATASATTTATASATSVATATSTATATATSTPVYIPGDVNGDDLVNIVDIGIIIDFYDMDSSFMPKADLSNDGKINIIDIGIVIDNYNL